MGGSKRKKGGKPGVSGKKRNNYPSQPLDWGAPPGKKESSLDFWTVVKLGSLLLVIFMIFLFFFVDSPQAIERNKKMAETARKRKAEMEKPPPPFNFTLTKEAESVNELKELLKEQELLVLIFDSTNDTVKAPPLWRRWEKLRKAMTKRSSSPFKLHDDEDLPTIIRQDCGGTGLAFCQTVLGKHWDKKPMAIIFRQKSGQEPKPFPQTVRSDKQIFAYLFELMQPAVKYYGTELFDECARLQKLPKPKAKTPAADERRRDLQKNCFDAFHDPDDQIPRVALFADDYDQTKREGPYWDAADSVRDFAKCALVDHDELSTQFGDEDAEGDVIKMYRKFDEQEITFKGDATKKDEIASWIRDNSLPLLGEFSPGNALSMRFRQTGTRRHPVLWLAINSADEDHEVPVAEGKMKEGRPVKYWKTTEDGKLKIIHNDAVKNKLSKQAGKLVKDDDSETKFAFEPEDGSEKDRIPITRDLLTNKEPPRITLSIVTAARPVAEKYKGKLIFMYLDSISNAQFAKDNLQIPEGKAQVIVTGGDQEARVDIEADSESAVTSKIERAIADHQSKLRGDEGKQGGQGGQAGGADDDSDDSDDDEDDGYDDDHDENVGAADDRIDGKAPAKPANDAQAPPAQPPKAAANDDDDSANSEDSEDGDNKDGDKKDL